MAKAKQGVRRTIRCYLCGRHLEVSMRTMSTTCPNCHKPIKVEDLRVKSYMPVNEVQTCGSITITRRGRVAARLIQSGQDINCEGSMEGTVEADGDVTLGPKSTWKGKVLQSRTLEVKEGAILVGRVSVPWQRTKR